jgi:hypothetical protein
LFFQAQSRFFPKKLAAFLVLQVLGFKQEKRKVLFNGKLDLL